MFEMGDGRSWSIDVQIDVVRCTLYIDIVHLINSLFCRLERHR